MFLARDAIAWLMIVYRFAAARLLFGIWFLVLFSPETILKPLFVPLHRKSISLALSLSLFLSVIKYQSMVMHTEYSWMNSGSSFSCNSARLS